MLNLDEICHAFEKELKLRKPDYSSDCYEALEHYFRYALDSGKLVFPKNKEQLLEEINDIIENVKKYFSRFYYGYRFNSCDGKIALGYNVKDALSSDKDIQTLANRIVKKYAPQKAERWKTIDLTIDLTLEKGASIYKIDEYFARIFAEIQKHHELNVNIYINFGENKLGRDNVRYLLDDQELINLKKLQQTIHKFCKGQLYFKEIKNSETCWDLEQVIKTNNCIHNLAEIIKDNKLSPFEALLFICTWAQKNISYYDVAKSADETTNTIVAAVNNLEIKCVGFSQFVTAVVKCLGSEYLAQDNLLMPNGTINVAYEKIEYDGKKFFCPNHSQSKCYLIDKKYGIDGEVIADALGVMRSAPKLRKLSGDISLLAMIPITTFSKLKEDNELYNIYSGDKESEKFNKLFSKIYVDGKGQGQILREAKRNEKIATSLEQHGISSRLYTSAYEKIIPLIFQELKSGDMIAPIPEIIDARTNSCRFDKTIAVCSKEIKDFWTYKYKDCVSKNNNKSNLEERTL